MKQVAVKGQEENSHRMVICETSLHYIGRVATQFFVVILVQNNNKDPIY